ncbi:MAG: ParA family protein [Tissierellia bacterium]|nr:ParA family protein [Tissierellia bacterium]
MGKIISVFNQKGGVGKTTTSINLAAALGDMGKKTLIVDMDPQGNCTSGLGVDKRSEINIIYDVLVGNTEIRDSIQTNIAKNLDIIPSNNNLAGFEIEYANKEWQNVLKHKIAEIKEDYDFIFIDSPPSLGILSIMSLNASDEVLVPMQCEYYSLEGISQLFETIDLVKENYNPNLKISGIVMCMYDGRTNLSLQVVEEVKAYFKDKVFSTMISRNVRLAEAPSHGLSILDYDRSSKGAKNYLDLAKEFLKRI